MTAWFAIICYTSTIASCLVFQNLPNADACKEVLGDVRGTNRTTARLERCSPYPSLARDVLTPH